MEQKFFREVLTSVYMLEFSCDLNESAVTIVCEGV